MENDNLQRAKEEASDKFDDFLREHPQSKIAQSVYKTIDEIVTSTYLQAVEDCRKVIASSRTVEEKHGMGEKEMMARAQAMVDLQSLKQTKD